MQESSNYFREQEPLELREKNINYDQLEFVYGLLYKVDQSCGSRTLLQETAFLDQDNFLVIRNVKEDGTFDNIKWLDVNLWLLSYTFDPTNNQPDYTFHLKPSENSHILEIVLNNEEDYLKFKLFLSLTCVIINPILDQEYKYISKIGQGSQASVDLYKLINDTNHEKFAVKKYALKPNKTYNEIPLIIMNEVRFLRELKICGNIIQLEQVYYHDNSLNMVMKFAQYGSLLKYLQKQKKFSEEQIRTIMAQLILAMDLMHRNRIIHRDIKPDNILLMDKKEMKICISDLGLACRDDDSTQINLKCGTPGYVAPEILKNQPFTTKADIFSLGSFFYNLLTGKNLFQGKDGKEVLLSNKLQNPFSIVCMNVNGVSAECKDLLQWMLQINQEQRPTAEQCISHKWFLKDQKALQNGLILNKNQKLLDTLFMNPPKEPQGNYDFSSFVQAPNYYELVQACNSSALFGSQLFDQSADSNRSNRSRGASSPGNVRFCYNQIISHERSKNIKTLGDQENNSGNLQFNQAASIAQQNMQFQPKKQKPQLKIITSQLQENQVDMIQNNSNNQQEEMIRPRNQQANANPYQIENSNPISNQVSNQVSNRVQLQSNRVSNQIRDTSPSEIADETVFQEYSSRFHISEIKVHDVESKYLEYIPISEFYNAERSMASRNKRVNTFLELI